MYNIYTQSRKFFINITFFMTLLIIASACQSKEPLPTLAILPSATVLEQSITAQATPILTELASSKLDNEPEIVATVSEQNVIIAAQSLESTKILQTEVMPQGLGFTKILEQQVPQQIVIQFDAAASPQEREDYIQSIGGQVVASIQTLDTVVMVIPDSLDLSDLPQSNIIASEEPDYYVAAQLTYPTNDPLIDQQLALQTVDVKSLWSELSSDLPTINVAVIDSGICHDHEDMVGRINVGWDYVEDDIVPQDEFGHGCGVAGIIAANINNNIGIAGIAPHVNLLPIRVLDAQGIGTHSDVAQAIVYAVDQGSEVINLSLGSPKSSSILQNAIDYALSHDIVVVAATGNSAEKSPFYPAAYLGVIAVGSIDSDLQISDFSNGGANVYAPGREVLTTTIDSGYATVHGTSYAAAHVSGIAAIAMSQNLELVQNGEMVRLRASAAEPETGAIQVPAENTQNDPTTEGVVSSLGLEECTSNTAIDISTGPVLTDASISSASEVDCYTFSGNNGDIIRSSVIETSGGLFVSQEVLRSDGTTLCSQTTLSERDCTLDATGSFTVFIKDYDQSDEGDYVFHLQRLNNPLGCTSIDLNSPPSPISGTIAEIGEVDCYTFSGTIGDMVRSGVSETDVGLFASQEVLRSDGTTLCSQTTISERDCTLDATGSFTVLIKDYYQSGTGNYVLHLQRLNSLVGCTTIDLNSPPSPISGTIAEIGEVDCYTFSGTNGDIVRSSVAESGGGLFVSQEVLKSDGTTLCSQTTLSERDCTLDGTGSFTVLIKDYHQSNMGDFVLHLQRLNNPLGCSFIDLNSPPSPISGTIAVIGEADCYTFSGTNGDVIRSSVAETDGGLFASQKVLRSDGTTLCSQTTLLERDCTLDATASFTVFIEDVDQNNTGGYALHLQRLNSPVGCSAIDLNSPPSPINSSINSSGEADCYTFSGNNGDVIRSSVVETSGNLFAHQEVMRSDGTTLCSQTSAMEVRCTLDATGDFTILVTDFVRKNIGNYALHLQRLNSPVGCTALSIGSLISGTIVTALQSDCYTITTSVADNLRIRIMDPGNLNISNQVLGSNSAVVCNSSTLNDRICNLPQNDTYNLFIEDSSGRNTGDYGLYVQSYRNPENTSVVAYGDTILGNITPPELHTYTFTGTSGDDVQFEIATTSGSAWIEIEVIRPDGTIVCLGDSNTTPATICTLDASGSHTVLVGTLWSATSSYTLQIDVGRYFGRHTAAPIAFAKEGPIHIKVSQDFSRIIEIRGDPACLPHEDHEFQYLPGLTIPIDGNNRFFAASIPLTIPASPGHSHSMDIDGVFFDVDGDGTPEQAYGGFTFYSNTDVCVMQWRATSILPDSDGDGWSDSSETILGSAINNDNSTPENAVVPTTLLASIPVCEDFVDNDDDSAIDTLDLGCPAPEGVVLRIQSHGPQRVSPGGTITYIIEFSNVGQESAENVIIVNKLPRGVDYVASSQGATYNAVTREVTWNLPIVAAQYLGELSVQGIVVWGLPQGTQLKNLVYMPNEQIVIPEPSATIDFTLEEITEHNLKIAGNIISKDNTGFLDLDIIFEEIPELELPTTTYFETEDTINFGFSYSFVGNSYDQYLIEVIKDRVTYDPNPLSSTVGAILGMGKDLAAAADRYLYFTTLHNLGTIDQSTYDNMIRESNSLLWWQFPLKHTPKLFAEADEGIDAVLRALWEANMRQLFDEAEPIYEGMWGKQIYRDVNDINPDDPKALNDALLAEFGNDWVDAVVDLYWEYYKTYKGGRSHALSEFPTDILAARDPNAKHVDREFAQPGEIMNFIVEFENEGAGIAYGVYITDVLEEDIDASTLVLPANEGGVYNPDTRMITWYVGEVGPGGTGEFQFSAHVSPTAWCGDEVTNYATVYFPSVPEVTPTNGVVVRVVHPDCDGDLDGIGDFADNCPAVFNPADADGDGSDGEDPLDGLDNDKDGLIDEDYENGQENADNDGEGDACDEDDDNDVMIDAFETFYFCMNPRIQDASSDFDEDNIPSIDEFNNNTDPCPPRFVKPPTNISATGLSRSEVDVDWTNVAPVAQKIFLERSPNGENSWQQIAELDRNATTYQDTGLLCTHDYFYRLQTYRAFDEQYSIYSDIVSGTALDCPDLIAPTNVSATALSRNQISFEWEDGFPGETTHFRLERVNDSQQIELAVSVLEFVDDTVVCGTDYQYYLWAYRTEDGDESTKVTMNVATPACDDPVTHTIGLYQAGRWVFREGFDNTSSIVAFRFGPQEPGWIPLTGDWDGDGIDGIGIYKEGIFVLRNIAEQGVHDYIYRFGNQESGWQPIVGDWNSDGIDTVGVYRDGVFLLTNSNEVPEIEYQFRFGPQESGWIAISGDWTASGHDFAGLYKEGVFKLHDSFETRSNPDNDFQPESDGTSFRFGSQEPNWIPIAGDWNRDGIMTIGLFKDNNWRLRNSNSRGQVDIGFRFGNFEGESYPLASYRGGEEAVQAMALMSTMPLADPLFVPDVTTTATLRPISTATVSSTQIESMPTVMATTSTTQVQVTETITWTPTIATEEPPISTIPVSQTSVPTAVLDFTPTIADESTFAPTDEPVEVIATETEIPTTILTETQIPTVVPTDTPIPVPTDTLIPAITDTPMLPTATQIPPAIEENVSGT